MRVLAGAAGDSERERKDEDGLPTHVHAGSRWRMAPILLSIEAETGPVQLKMSGPRGICELTRRQ
jgi:hypothetical protein